MDFTYEPDDIIIYVATDGADYHLKSAHFVLSVDGSNFNLSGNSIAGKTYFGVETPPIFSFGKHDEFSVSFGVGKKQACLYGGYIVSQETILASVAETTKNFLDKLSLEQWIPTSFNPETREVCIQINTDVGMNNIVVELA